MKTYGSRAEVFHGNAKMTTGKLEKKDLVINKHGRIVSAKKVKQSKDPNKNPLLKGNFLAKRKSSKRPGVFGPNEQSLNNKNNSTKSTKSKKSSLLNNLTSIFQF